MNNNFYLCFYDSVIVSYYKVVLIRIYLFIYLFICVILLLPLLL